MNMTDLTTTEGNDQFYPTPESIAEKMLSGVDWSRIRTVLEPSAGKGDLIYAAAHSHYLSRYKNGVAETLDVDAIEIDPYLREICKYNFSEQREEEWRDIFRKYDRMDYRSRTDEQRAEMDWAEDQMKTIGKTDLHIVFDDFLSFKTYKHYDLILMNPPFANGDLHLLKALEMQKRGGSIICLLNAETVLNPYSVSRKLLQSKLDEYGATVEILPDAFSVDAERHADVDVALIKVYIPEEKRESTLFERMKKAAETEHVPDAEVTALVPNDYIDRAICLYNAEVAATMELVRDYAALKPYITLSFDEGAYNHDSPIVRLAIGSHGDYDSFDQTKYLRLVRAKYWNALFHNEKFMERLTSNLQQQFRENVDKMADYDFSAFNIKQVVLEMNASMQQGVKDTIMKLFEDLSQKHSWYPECEQTIHYYNGWKTNLAHKIGKKAIVPSYGMFRSYSQELDVYNAYHLLSDIEKALDYLDGGHFTGNRYNLHSFLEAASRNSQLRNIECTYFLVDIFKKGTVHIKFRPETMPLIDRLNVFAAKGKNWLPPCYGKKTYAEMDAEERTVVDGLNGDGSEGSGELAYAEVLRDSAYYLSEPAAQLLALTEEAS